MTNRYCMVFINKGPTWNVLHNLIGYPALSNKKVLVVIYSNR